MLVRDTKYHNMLKGSLIASINTGQLGSEYCDLSDLAIRLQQVKRGFCA